jgi:hypothetical protein
MFPSAQSLAIRNAIFSISHSHLFLYLLLLLHTTISMKAFDREMTRKIIIRECSDDFTQGSWMMLNINFLFL